MEIKTLKTDRFEMEYFSFGSGKKSFVILPGLSLKPVTLSAQLIAEAYADFAKAYTVYVFDRKKEIQEGYTVFQMAEDTEEAMKSLGIFGADVFGASQGGMIGQCMAIFYPETVYRLMLGSTLSRPSLTSLATVEEWCCLAKKGDAVSLNRSIAEKVYSEAYREKHKEAFSALEHDGTAEEMKRFGILAEACRGFAVYGELSRIRCPVLVLGSKQDKVLGEEASVELAEKLGCECYLYEGYSHAVYDEAPDFRERLLRFCEI